MNFFHFIRLLIITLKDQFIFFIKKIFSEQEKIRILPYFKNVKFNLPMRSTEYSEGLDLIAIDDFIVKSKSNMCVPTNLKIEMSDKFYCKIENRSSMGLKNNIIVMCGLIDSDYKGEIKVILYNLGNKDYIIKNGDKFAQLVFYNNFDFNQINKTDFLQINKKRLINGFGSTDL